jgi:DNA invertase Pin-like site-specific DNA recombinase
MRMLERLREGIAKAKGESKYKGRKPIAKAKAADVVRVDSKGMLREMIADTVGVSLTSFIVFSPTPEGMASQPCRARSHPNERRRAKGHAPAVFYQSA